MPEGFPMLNIFYIKKHGGMQTQARPLRGGDKKPSKKWRLQKTLEKVVEGCYIIKV